MVTLLSLSLESDGHSPFSIVSLQKPGVDPSDPQQQEAALRIQTQFRQHSAQQEVAEMKEEEAAIRIQAGFRGYIDRQEIKKRIE